MFRSSSQNEEKMGSLASCFAPQAEGEETKGAFECEAELVSVMLGLVRSPGFDPYIIRLLSG
jgi:hypothetical protein